MKLVGLTTISFGLVLSVFEWLHDFKINGWSWALVVSAAVLLERIHHDRKIRDMLKKIGNKVGVEWNADKLNFYENMDSLPLKQLRKVTFPALFAMLFTRRKVTNKSILSKEKMRMNFLKNNVSKKLVVAIVTILLASLNTKLGLGMSDETILVIASTASVYVAGQSHVDAKTAQSTPVQNPNEPNQTY